MPDSVRLSALEPAIANLIDNAVMYGRESERSVIDCPAELSILVEDRGPSIAAAEIARVVEPYVRLEASRSRATAGVDLGLAIARDAARLHGGDARLESRSGRGPRAMLLLPRGHPD